MAKSTTGGFIYILTNPSFPDYVKIGYADDVEDRVGRLNKSECIPFAFRIYARYYTPARLTDLKVHEMIDAINPDLRSVENFNGKTRKREFYAMSAEDGYKILETIAKCSGTESSLKREMISEEEKADEEEAGEIRNRTALPKMDWLYAQGVIKNGDVVFYKKKASDKATIINDSEVEFNGKTMSLLDFAKIVTTWDHVNAYRYLILERENKTLRELREAKMKELDLIN